MTAASSADINAWFGGVLRCPVCRGSIVFDETTVQCAAGHRYDLARQGYVSLRSGRPAAKTGDTSEMVAARERFLGAGHYAPIADGLAELVSTHRPRLAAPPVLDLAGGTGYYLARVLDASVGAVGVCMDLSTPALRRAAGAHPRGIAVGGDVWQPFPVTDRSVAAVTSVFGPRNFPEIERVLIAGGILVTVTPNPDHLGELIEPLGMLHVGEDKQERLAASLRRFETVASEDLRYRVRIDRRTVADIVGMGPSAHHVTADESAARIESVPETSDVTVSVHFGVHRIGAMTQP